ncbi:hypothetical protein MNY66_16510 (plasmid) [Moellerella wisconsensis]|uniref:Uncharacterized protein n=2 Tax=Morganellaceae TaxID=1903414 RepID=A0ACD3YCC1_9GAMM|nr:MULTISPECIES: hypothetical protein [Morganellaceae]QCJ72226.1 hypothetical protein C9446_20715 [Providencia heimbachae]UNH40645.1 hypothetical protein MNY70_17560 [Moellerella wisconsensis]UNH44349.1 hypothetical protein MNY66_16510 [Moellerella wisconsensis]
MTTLNSVEQLITEAEASVLCEVYNFLENHQRYPLVSELSGQSNDTQPSAEILKLEQRGILSLSYSRRVLTKNNQRFVCIAKNNGCAHLRFPSLKFKSRNHYKPLTKKQAELLQYVYNYITKYGHSPSQREMYKSSGEWAFGILLDKGIIYQTDTSLYQSDVSRRGIRVSPGFGMDQLSGQPDILPRTLMLYEAICAELKTTTLGYVTKNSMLKLVLQKDIWRSLNELQSIGYIRMVKKSGRSGYSHIYLGPQKPELISDPEHAPLMTRCVN